MNHNFRDMLDDFVICYLDDILVFSDTPVDHEQHVKRVLQRLRDIGLYAKASKCEFHTKSVEFLGFIISDKGIGMDKKKVQTILDWPKPCNLHDVRSFLGFCNFYRRFIKGYSTVANPLIRLTRNDVPFTWTNIEQEAFEALKSKFTLAGFTTHYDPELPLVLETDTSDYAIAGVLSHEVDGILVPVAFFSRKLSPAELNYEIHDKEMLAIVACFKEWRHYLEGASHKVTVYTDHRSLEYFTTSKQLNRRQARWSEFLSEFDFVIVYRPGVKGTKPDTLTRRPDYHPQDKGSSLSTTANPQNFKPLLGPQQYLATSTNINMTSDIVLRLKNLMEKDPAREFYYEEAQRPSNQTFTYDENGLVMHTNRWVVPNDNELRLQLVKEVHDHPTAGHPGQRKTLQLLQRNYWWPHMKGWINNYIDTCHECKRAKARRHSPYGFLKPLPVPPYPWSSVSMDLIEGLPKSNGFDCILVIVDRLTKMAIFIPTTKSLTAEDLAWLYVKHVFSKHGVPQTIVSDRGKEFDSRFFKAFTNLLGIDLTMSTTYHPETDGQTERVNQSLEQYLRLYTNYKQDDWYYMLPVAEFTYNNTPHSATTVSPFFANKGYHPRSHFTPRDVDHHSPQAKIQVDGLSDLHNHLREQMQVAAETAKHFYDKHRSQSPDYKVGQKVWLDARNIDTKRPMKKLDHKYFGPFKILKKLSPEAYRLDLPASMRALVNSFNVKLLEPYAHDEHINNPIPNRRQPPPPPIEIDREVEYEVQEILDHKKDQRYKDPNRYLNRWLGYDQDEDQWVGTEALENSQDLLVEFWDKRKKQRTH